MTLPLENELSPSEALPSALVAEVRALLTQADEAWRQGRASLPEALRACDAALKQFARAERDGELPRGGLAGLRGEVGLKRGQVLEAMGTVESLREAVRSHEAALVAVSAAGDAPVRLRALIWMNRGNALLGQGNRTAAREAVRSFDETLAWLSVPSLEGGETAEQGMTAGAAWLNRAAAVQAADGDAGRGEAGDCLLRAIRRLTPLAAEHVPARRNLAGAWMNRAEWLRAGGDGEGALAAWQRAAELVAGEVGRDARALELTLRARHAICVTLGERFAGGAGTRDATGTTAAMDRAEAAVHVERGLAEFAAWKGAAEGSRATATRLFEFGAWLFRTGQMRRLAGFLEMHTEPGDARRAEIARINLHLARQEILRMDFSELLAEEGSERRTVLQALGAFEARLAAGGRERE